MLRLLSRSKWYVGKELYFRHKWKQSLIYVKISWNLIEGLCWESLTSFNLFLTFCNSVFNGKLEIKVTFWDAEIAWILKINNRSTIYAKTNNLCIAIKLIQFLLKNTGIKGFLTTTIFEIELFQGRSILAPVQRRKIR